jgi:hypothetical protein
MLTGRFGVVLSALVFASALVAVPDAAGETPVTTVVAFDPQHNEFPEGLAMTRRRRMPRVKEYWSSRSGPSPC